LLIRQEREENFRQKEQQVKRKKIPISYKCTRFPGKSISSNVVGTECRHTWEREEFAIF
jgi:hypothetical protein